MYLMARAIQFFTPGIPMIYYVGLLAGENDLQVRRVHPRCPPPPPPPPPPVHHLFSPWAVK